MTILHISLLMAFFALSLQLFRVGLSGTHNLAAAEPAVREDNKPV